MVAVLDVEESHIYPWVDSIAFIASVCCMKTTLTIRNLNETVKQKLRIRAARHQTSMEAEVRSILTRAVDEPDAVEASSDPAALMAERRRRIEAVVGVWKDRGTTDDLMALTRGED